MQSLGTLPNATDSKAFAINNSGTIVGSSGTEETTHAFNRSSSGGIRDLGTLPGDSESEAFGINERGDVVGYSNGPSGMRAFLWSDKEGMKSLGTLPGGISSRALSINQQGVVVGSSQTSVGVTHPVPRAFVWSPAGGMQDLNALIAAGSGVFLMEAVGINARGQILVLGRTSQNSQLPLHEGWDKAFLLTP
jgi:probable HAF family extracellular repeat protein